MHLILLVGCLGHRQRENEWREYRVLLENGDNHPMQRGCGKDYGHPLTLYNMWHQQKGHLHKWSKSNTSPLPFHWHYEKETATNKPIKARVHSGRVQAGR